MPRTELGMTAIYLAQARIREFLQPSLLRRSAYLSGVSGGDVYLKLESLQPTGSFKVRGAINRMAALLEDVRKAGVVTGSAGNHGLGVAFAASCLGITEVDIFIPENTPLAKVDRLGQFPVRVHREGTTYENAHQAALRHSAKSKALYIHAYDDVEVIAGQGTAGLEIFTELPAVETIIVPVGGGGLIAGIATAAKEINPLCEVVGVQAQASPSALLSFQEGAPLDPYDHEPTIADGLAGGFGKMPFLLARTLIDEILLADEEELKQAVFTLIEREKLVAEPSGAASIVPILASPGRWAGKRVVCVISGANLATEILRQIFRGVPGEPGSSGGRA
jgi:threonine dehydratase